MENSYYNYVEEHKLLIECFCGETKIEDAFELKNEIESNLSQVPKFSVLVDIQNSSTKTSFRRIENLVEFYLESKFTIKIDCIAIITNTPSQVVNTILFIDALKKERNIPIKTFSSVESAVNWLQSGIKVATIESILEDFKNTRELDE